jgi:putative membrane protein
MLTRLRELLDQAEALGNDQRVVVDVVLGPEAFVRAAPVLDGLEALALVAGELEIDVACAHDPDLGRLDHGHGPVVEVEQREALTELGQRLVGERSVVGSKPGGGRLVAAKDRVDELAAQVGARVAELERREFVHPGEDTSDMTDGVGRTLLVSALVGWGVNIVALLVIDGLFDSVEIGRWGPLLIGAAVLALANAFVKPVLTVLTLPLILLTLGLSYFALNVLMLALAEWIAPDFSIDGFWTYVGATIIVSLVNWILNVLLPDGD